MPIATLCEVTATNVTTAARHCNAMAERGAVTKDGRGWMLRVEALLETNTEASVQEAVAYYLRRIREMMVLGFDPATPGWLGERPPLVSYQPLPAIS